VLSDSVSQPGEPAVDLVPVSAPEDGYRRKRSRSQQELTEARAVWLHGTCPGHRDRTAISDFRS